VRPGSTATEPIRLPEARELAADDVLIPAGWCPTGGDPNAAGTLPARRVWVDAFVMRRFPVTHGAWLEWLNALVAAGREAEALERVPKATAAVEGDAGLYDRDPVSGRFSLPAGGPWGPDHPVCNVDWASADAYAAWVAAQTGLPWRLPGELEWEKAARGVDGRSLPWGQNHDFSWCVTAESHAGPPAPAPVDSYPDDVSPYGVRGLGGGVRDWVLEEFAPEGPKVTPDGLAIVAPPRPDAATHGTRGGAWSLPAWVSCAACRGYHPSIRLADLGFRLVRPLASP
jgi:serine/threonine-protein kinase